MPADPNLLLQQLQGGPQTPDALLDTLFSTNPGAQVFTGDGGTKTRYTLSGDYEEKVDGTKTVAELVKSFYAIEGDDLRDLQNDLFVGGFYGDATPDDIAWGQQDNATYSAYVGAVVRASRYYAAGRKLTVDEVLDLTAQSAGKESGGRKAPAVAQLSDPVGLSSSLDSAAQKVLGRKATNEEKRLFMAAIHEDQRANAGRIAQINDAQSGINPDGSISTTSSRQSFDVVGVDPAARAEEFARQADPTRAGARDVVGAFSAMAEMFGGNF